MNSVIVTLNFKLNESKLGTMLSVTFLKSICGFSLPFQFFEKSTFLLDNPQVFCQNIPNTTKF